MTKLTPAGRSLVYSTYLGGRNDDYGNAIAVDANGSAYVTKRLLARLSTFVVLRTRLRDRTGPSGPAPTYSTWLGGSADDEGYGIALGSTGAAYVTGIATRPISRSSSRLLKPTERGLRRLCPQIGGAAGNHHNRAREPSHFA